MQMCAYLIDKFGFKYLLSPKVNQDNLEKFFGTIRQSAGCNDHPSCPTFLQVYKPLSEYSVIKPPKYGNCTISEESSSTTIISISDLKAAYEEGSKAKRAKYLQEIRTKLDSLLQQGDLEADDVIEYNSGHAYTLSPIQDCIVYCVTAFLS